jgi:integrase/recombinase XerD
MSVYLCRGNPFLLKSEQTDAYFLSNRGAGMSRQNFFYAVKSYAIKWFFYQVQLTVAQLLECLKK